MKTPFTSSHPIFRIPPYGRLALAECCYLVLRCPVCEKYYLVEVSESEFPYLHFPYVKKEVVGAAAANVIYVS